MLRNFAFWLFAACLVTGIISLLDIFYFSKKREPNTKPGFIIENARSFLPILILVFLLRSFLIEPFRIPSGSLEPTLLVGDFVATNKYIYGIRLPIIEKKIINIASPKTGDIVVFRWTPDPTIDYIKRVIGVPGDVVEYQNKILKINGVEAKQKFIKYTTDPSSGESVAEYLENLKGVKHRIFKKVDDPAVDFKVTVPQNNYFVMGDNRDASSDSRFWGFVSDDNIRAKAFLTWFSWDNKEHSVRWNRIGRGIN